MKNLCILLDLDEVLVDFVGGAARLFGLTRTQVEEHWEEGHWSMIPPLNRAIASTDDSWERISEEDFYNYISAAGSRFWAELERHEWYDEVLDTVQRTCGKDDWYIVTSPTRCPSSAAGKMEWARNNLGGHHSQRLVITSQKYLLARPNSLLIDDREESVQKFIESGGRGIVFPRRHNSLHEYAYDPHKYLSAMLSDRGLTEAIVY